MTGPTGARGVLARALAIVSLALLIAGRGSPAAAQQDGPGGGAEAASAGDTAEATGPAAGARAGRSGGTRRPIASWTSDRRAFSRGDVLTVFVDDRTLARAVSGNEATSSREFLGDIGFFGTGGRAGLDGEWDSEKRGRATRDERFRTELSARVKEITPGGVLEIEGRKTFKVDKHEQTVVLRGFVRPEDVSTFNVVDGWRVANLELLYESNGKLQEPDKGIISSLLGILF